MTAAVMNYQIIYIPKNAGMDHQFMGKQDFEGNFDPFRVGFDMIG